MAFRLEVYDSRKEKITLKLEDLRPGPTWTISATLQCRDKGPSPNMTLDRMPLVSSLFVIEDDGVNPQLCTERIGLLPTASGIKGDRPPGSRWPVPISFWKIKFTKEPRADIEGGLIKLLELLWPARDRITRFLDESSFSAAFGSRVSIYHEPPSYFVSAPTIAAPSNFGVGYDLDIYDYTDHVAEIARVSPTGDPDLDILPVVTTALLIEGSNFDAGSFVSSLNPAPSSPIKHPYRMEPGTPNSVLAIERRRLDDIDIGISELLDLLWPARGRIRRDLAELGATVTVRSSVWIYVQDPVYQISAESLRRLAELDMAFQLEVYDSRKEKIILKLEDLRPGWRKDNDGAERQSARGDLDS